MELKFEITGRKYAIDIEESKFMDLLDSESYVTNGGAFQPGCQTLCEKLNPMPGVWGVDYNGHFGAAVYMTIDADEDTNERKTEIAAIIQKHLEWCAGLHKQEHVVERRKAAA